MSGPVVMTRTAFITADGDSLNDPTLPYGSFNGLFAAIDSHYMPPDGASFRRPVYTNFATSGAFTSTLLSRVSEVNQNATTHYFAQCGINDVNAGVPLATSEANVTSIMNFVTGLGIKALWVGPLCYGELWPSGANVNDAAIVAWDAAIAAIVNSYAGCAYVSPRTAIYNVQEPILNVPGPPGVGSGILTVPAGSLGIHTNPTGNSFFPALELGALSLT